MRYLFIATAACIVSMLWPVAARAIETIPAEQVVVKTESPLMITSYSTTAHRINYIQLYNSSGSVQSLDGWKIDYTINGRTYELPLTLSGLIAPDNAVIVADATIVPTALFRYTAPDVMTTDTHRVTSLRLIPPATSATLEHTVSPSYPSGSRPIDTYYFTRSRSTTTGNYLSSFTATPTPPANLQQDPLYEYDESTPLQTVEILANSRNCGPTETAVDCLDYIKFYNPTNQAIDLSQLRLRNGYVGQAISSSNTMQLGGFILPGEYHAIQVNITNSGGWVWLEDQYGMTMYETTLVEYPDARSTTKKSLSWAQNDDGIWGWATPQPGGPNELLAPEEIIAKETGQTPCREDQYRNPETGRCKKYEVDPMPVSCNPDQERNPDTNRCRKIATASSLASCDADEYRNPDTNRCRKLSTDAATLTPCKEGQYRSPETNRCRSLSTASSDLKPCEAGQERNPATNRCRKIVSGDGGAGFAVVDESTSSDQVVSWLALGGLGLASLGYAGWEWRRELFGVFSKVASLLPFVK